jgi:hypothetical protein
MCVSSEADAFLSQSLTRLVGVGAGAGQGPPTNDVPLLLTWRRRLMSHKTDWTPAFGLYDTVTQTRESDGLMGRTEQR